MDEETAVNVLFFRFCATFSRSRIFSSILPISSSSKSLAKSVVYKCSVERVSGLVEAESVVLGPLQGIGVNGEDLGERAWRRGHTRWAVAPDHAERAAKLEGASVPRKGV